MTDNYRIVPYKTQHGDEMIEFGLNDKLMDIDASFKENRIDFAMAGLAFTLLDDNVPICSGGVVPTWLGNAQGWVISSKRIFRNKIKAHRQICIYAYSRQNLLKFIQKKKSPIEKMEDIEILRFLDIGISVKMIKLSDKSISVDVPEDINKVEKALSK